MANPIQSDDDARAVAQALSDGTITGAKAQQAATDLETYHQAMTAPLSAADQAQLRASGGNVTEAQLRSYNANQSKSIGAVDTSQASGQVQPKNPPPPVPFTWKDEATKYAPASLARGVLGAVSPVLDLPSNLMDLGKAAQQLPYVLSGNAAAAPSFTPTARPTSAIQSGLGISGPVQTDSMLANLGNQGLEVLPGAIAGDPEASLAGAARGLARAGTVVAGQNVGQAVGGQTGATLGGILGGALGEGGINAARAVTAPTVPMPAHMSNLSEPMQRVAGAGQDLDFQFTPGQLTGNKATLQQEAKLASNPQTSTPYAAIGEHNQTTLNRIAARSIGENSDTVDSEVLGRAADRLGDVFDAARNKDLVTPITSQDTQTAINAAADAQDLPKASQDKFNANGEVQQLAEFGRAGTVNNQQLGSLSSRLGQTISQEWKSPNPDAGYLRALQGVKDHVDGLLQDALPEAQQAEYAQARQQYRALMQLQKPGVVNSANGNVSGANLSNSLRNSDVNGYTRGGNQSDLYNAARVSSAFKSSIGDSGTATRTAPTPREAAINAAMAPAPAWTHAVPILGPVAATGVNVARALAKPWLNQRAFNRAQAAAPQFGRNAPPPVPLLGQGAPVATGGLAAPRISQAQLQALVSAMRASNGGN